MEVVTLRLLNALLHFANYRVGHHQTGRKKLAVLFTHQQFFHLSKQLISLLLVCLSIGATFITYTVLHVWRWPRMTPHQKWKTQDSRQFFFSSLKSEKSDAAGGPRVSDAFHFDACWGREEVWKAQVQCITLHKDLFSWCTHSSRVLASSAALILHTLFHSESFWVEDLQHLNFNVSWILSGTCFDVGYIIFCNLHFKGTFLRPWI